MKFSNSCIFSQNELIRLEMILGRIPRNKSVLIKATRSSRNPRREQITRSTQIISPTSTGQARHGKGREAGSIRGAKPGADHSAVQWRPWPGTC